MKCPECKGLKKVWGGSTDKLHNGWKDCPNCKGEGKVVPQQPFPFAKEDNHEKADSHWYMDWNRVDRLRAEWGWGEGRQ